MKNKYLKLKEIFICLESGKREKGGALTSDGIPSIGAEHLDNYGGFNFKKIKFISSSFFEKFKKGVINYNDILIVKDGATTGKVSFVDNSFPYKKSAVNEHVFILRIDDKEMLPKFVFYYLFSEYGKKNILRSFHGSGQGGINKNFIDFIKLPITLKENQNLIVKQLDNIRSKIEKRKETIRLADEFLKSTFVEMFGEPQKNNKNWEMGIINNIVKYSEYGISEKSNNEKIGYPILGMGNISYNGELDFSNLKYVNISKEEFEKIKLQNMDVIFNRTNSSERVGKTSFWNKDKEAVLASYLVKLRLKDEFNAIWFTFLLNTDYFKKLFQERCRKSVNQSNINPTLLKQFPAYLPPIEIQNKFAKVVLNIIKIKQQQKESLTELENLFNSLMQKAFRGEIVKNKL
ncbi:restriction endonuclease subunit S [Candidatus Dependentiae bacterium]|nr:restriction endonuclease subunit S [Candidatus Dependentiae bacterium]